MSTNTKPSIVFFGTPDLAVWVLEELALTGITPSLIVTTPDKPVGRKLVLTPPPVKTWAENNGIPVLQTPSLKDRSAVPELANGEWDLFIVAAYNIILPEWVLEHPRYGVLNVHPSLLPKFRGPSPIRSAILENAEDAVGVTIMKLDREIDHGPLVAQARVELPAWPVPGHELDELLFREGGRLLAEVIPLWIQGTITPEEQRHEEATYTKKFEKDDGELHLDDEPYKKYLQYCAMDGWPGTYFFVEKNNERIRVKITDATYEDGSFRIRSVIPEGKKEQPWDVFSASYLPPTT